MTDFQKSNKEWQLVLSISFMALGNTYWMSDALLCVSVGAFQRHLNHQDSDLISRWIINGFILGPHYREVVRDRRWEFGGRGSPSPCPQGHLPSALLLCTHPPPCCSARTHGAKCHGLNSLKSWSRQNPSCLVEYFVTATRNVPHTAVDQDLTPWQRMAHPSRANVGV